MIPNATYNEMRELSNQLIQMEKTQEVSDQYNQMKEKMGRFLTMIYIECNQYILKNERFSLDEFQLSSIGSVRLREESVFSPFKYFYVDLRWGWENNEHTFRVPKNKVLG